MSGGAPQTDATKPVGSVRRAFDRLASTRLTLACAALLACLGLLGVFADVLAADFPIVGKIHGTLYVMPCVTEPVEIARLPRDARMGRDAGDWAVGPLVGFGAHTIDKETAPLSPPSLAAAHPLGTDAKGRDLFARLVHGTRTALGLALVAVALYLAVGSVLGALSGFFGGLLDFVVERVTEALSAFPVLVLVLVVQALLAHPTAISMLLAIAAVRWTEVARLVRADVLVASQQDFATAARALGASPARVLYRHVLPQAVGPLIVAGALGLGQIVLVESSLDFLRVGLPEPTASWGESLAESRDFVSAWWLLLFPSLFVLAAVVSSNVVGEALRDALDPRYSPGIGGRAPTAPRVSRASVTSRTSRTSRASDG